MCAQGSDHCLLKMKLRMSNTCLVDWREVDVIRFDIGDRTDYTKYRQGVSGELRELLTKSHSLTTEEQVEEVQRILLGKAKECFKRKIYPYKPKMRLKLPYNIKNRLQELNKARMRLRRLEVKVKRGSESKSDDKLVKLRAEINEIKTDVQSRINKEKVKKRAKVRRLGLSPTMGVKQFWKLVKLKSHPELIVWAFKTKAGKLEIELENILKEIQSEVTEKFKASNEKVFKSEYEQIKLQLEACQSLGLKPSDKD